MHNGRLPNTTQGINGPSRFWPQWISTYNSPHKHCVWITFKESNNFFFLIFFWTIITHTPCYVLSKKKYISEYILISTIEKKKIDFQLNLGHFCFEFNFWMKNKNLFWLNHFDRDHWKLDKYSDFFFLVSFFIPIRATWMDFLHLRKLPTDYKLHNLRELFRKEKELQFFFTEIAEIQLTTTENWKNDRIRTFRSENTKKQREKNKKHQGLFASR